MALKNESGVLNGSEVTTNITIIGACWNYNYRIVLLFYPIHLDPLKILPTTPRGIIYVTVGESVTFNCTASGTDVLVTWYQNASEILNYNESLFTIENAVFEDSSVYQCIWYSEAQDLYEQATWGLVVSLPMMINGMIFCQNKLLMTIVHCYIEVIYKQQQQHLVTMTSIQFVNYVYRNFA